jgi:pimeloyl-ACP methyl ester carboxylesterase
MSPSILIVDDDPIFLSLATRILTLYDRVGALSIPVDVVFGLEDRRVARSSLGGYERLDNVTVTRIPGVGHSPPLEAPQAVADVLIAATGG